MNCDISSTNNLIKALAGSLSLRSNYFEYIHKRVRLILVEGSTDEKFFKHVIDNDVDCLAAGKIFRANADLRNASNNIFNNKKAVAQTVVGLNNYAPILECPTEIKQIELYGIIDLDFEDSSDYTNMERLFVTDTHDLETMMLCTDTDLIYRIPCISISEEAFKESVSMAYQLAEARLVVMDYFDASELSLNVLSKGYSKLKYEMFFSNDTLNIFRLIAFLNEEGGKTLSAEKINRIQGKMGKDKRFKKAFDSNGTFLSHNLNMLDNQDMWKKVNGHDLLTLIRHYHLPSVAEFNDKIDGLNRAFENALIDYYEYGCLEKTNLYKQLDRKGLIKHFKDE